MWQEMAKDANIQHNACNTNVDEKVRLSLFKVKLVVTIDGQFINCTQQMTWPQAHLLHPNHPPIDLVTPQCPAVSFLCSFNFTCLLDTLSTTGFVIIRSICSTVDNCHNSNYMWLWDILRHLSYSFGAFYFLL